MSTVFRAALFAALAAASVPLVAGGQATSKPVEAWECRDRFAFNWESVLVKATIDSGREKGNLFVAGVTHDAVFRVEGFNRRWDFGLSADRNHRYSFIIEPNGDASYVDFGNDAKAEAKASNLMNCRQIGRANVLWHGDEGSVPPSESQVFMESVVEERPELLTRPPLQYPKLLREAGVQGRVLVQAIIDTSGRAEPSSVKVIQSPNPGFDSEAKRMVLAARFRPGRIRGHAVRVLVNLPVDFKR